MSTGADIIWLCHRPIINSNIYYIMKKISSFLFACAALVVSFTSCGGGENKPFNPNDIVEDGCYVVGEATSVADLKASNATTALMTAGKNEADGNKIRKGLYEKYVALEGGKEFKIILKEGSSEIVYGATLAEYKFPVDENGYATNDQPNGMAYKGTLAENAAMQVKENGLYHVIMDEETKAIIVCPVKWGVRGVNDDWGWKEMKASAFNKETMTFTIHYDEVKAGKFKFAYSGGWKIYLSDVENDDKTIAVNTNLGAGMENGGSDIEIKKANNADITLVWTNKGGLIKDNYSFDVKSEIVIEKPETFVVGFSGSNAVFADQDGEGEWVDPQEKTLAKFDADASKFDATTFDGTYVYKVDGIKFGVGPFKARFNGQWLGWGQFDIAGDVDYFTANEGDDNVKCNAEKTYNCVFTVVWKDGKVDGNIKVDFQAI